MGRKHIKKKHKSKVKTKSVTKDQCLNEHKLKETSEAAALAEDIPQELPHHSIDRLLAKAEQLIDEFNYELAQKFCQRALELEPDNVRALETSASLLLELGDMESAKRCLGRAVEMSPDSGFTKYMTMGQLLDGALAVQCYQKGIELMVKEKESKEMQEVAAACSNAPSVTDNDISRAYCALAEIYLTDCCFDDAAEEKCLEYVDKAVSSDQENAEAWQIKASYLISKDKKAEAKEVIKKSVSLWLPKMQAIDVGDVPAEEFDPVELCPIPYAARIQCGKILIEVEEYEVASDVLEMLLDEDDEVPDVWYLLAWANYLHGEEYFGNARHYLQRAREVYVKVKHQDPELLGHIDELIKELGADDPSDVNNVELDIETSSDEEMDQ